MRLTMYIEKNRSEIVREWVRFAETLHPWAKGQSKKALRDHAEELLEAVAIDMGEPQTRAEGSTKSRGAKAVGVLGRIGQSHASDRLQGGLTLEQLVSEYRALRASVLRGWEKHLSEGQGEITRFNEAIDEALAESSSRYSTTVNHTKDQFLGVLGHDLRNPLGAILMGSQVLMKSPTLGEREARVATRIFTSAQRMGRMVDDLLDLTRTRLGAGIPIKPKRMELKAVCEEVVAELQLMHPERKLRFTAKGQLHGSWDRDRISQVLSNLVANAIQHGGDGGLVSVMANSHGKDVAVHVHNGGRPIPKNAQQMLFEPMVRHQNTAATGPDLNTTGLGLGLYIAREIVRAHGGTITVSSTQKAGTTFSVMLPRRGPKQKESGLAD